MEPTNNRPARRRLTEAELRSALAHMPLTLDEVREVTHHTSVDVLVAYFRSAQSPTDTPDDTPRRSSTRTLRATAATLARRAGMTPQPFAHEVTGHRGDSTELYLRRQEPIHTTDEDSGEQ
jgi:hypothetical protein